MKKKREKDIDLYMLKFIRVHVIYHFLYRGTTFVTSCLLPWMPKPYKMSSANEVRTRKSGVMGSIPGLATYFRFSFLFFKKGSCQLLAKVCARSTG